MMSSEGFQYHFSIISKFICCDCYMKKNVAFTLISFAVLKWHECLSFQLPFELTVEIPVQLHLELEVNLLVHNVSEREIEREKVQMKPPHVGQGPCFKFFDMPTLCLPKYAWTDLLYHLTIWETSTNFHWLEQVNEKLVDLSKNQRGITSHF